MYNKIFIQAGPTGDNTGWGDLVEACTTAGIPVFAAASDSMTLLFDLQMARHRSGVAHRGNFVPTVGKDGNRFDFDYTIYPNAEAAKKAYQANAVTRWKRAEAVIPPELDPQIITISLENEQRPYVDWHDTPAIPGFTGWADAIGWQAYYTGLEARSRGWRYAAFAFAGGNPQEGVWEQPGMLAYLRLCEQYPDWLGIALHEYSFTRDIEDGWGHNVGRFQQLHEVCDRHEIARPFIQIKEFGWGEREMPVDLDKAMSDIEKAAALYATFPNIHGAAIWTTQTGWGELSERVRLLIPRLKGFTVAWGYDGDVPLPPPPTTPDPTPEQLLVNPSFEAGWETIDTGYGGLKNQRPHGWRLMWLGLDSPIWAANRKTGQVPVVTSVPECLHKIDWQLPPEERPGGERELIRDGKHVYKVFAQNGIWGVALTQTVEGPINTLLDVRIPVQVHYQDVLNPDSPDDVEIQLLANGRKVAEWLAIPDLPDREWAVLTAQGMTDGNGRCELTLRMMTKWQNSRDVFLDGLSVTAVPVNAPTPPAPPPAPVPPTPPAPPAPPTECRGKPRVQYARAYNVVPQGATEEQAVAIFREAWRRSKETVGGSYDDAGVGDLAKRKARLYGIAREEQATYRQWFGQHYPGVEVVFAEIPSGGGSSPAPAPPPPTQPPATGAAVVGLHASADPGALFGGTAEYEEFKVLRPGVIKVLSGHGGEVVERLAQDQRSIGNSPQWIIRTFLKFGGRDVSPQQFFEWTISDTQRAVNALRRAGVDDGRIWVELHNEPNLTDEGLGRSWQDGHGFASWGKAVLAQYRRAMPNFKMLFPGLSPGGFVPKVRYDAAMFTAQARPFAEACDGVAVHAYWQHDPYPMAQALSWVAGNADAFPRKPIWVTEASWNQSKGELPSVAFIGQQYKQFVAELKRIPTVQGVTYFVASASDPVFQPECWVVNGRSRGIAAVIRG